MEQIKRKLMSSNESTQITGLKLIRHEISQLLLSQKIYYVNFLLQNNIGHTLCDILPTQNDKLSDLIATTLEELTISLNFYNNGTAWEAIVKIITIMNLIENNNNKNLQNIVDRLFIAFGEILYKAMCFMLHLSNYFDMNKIFECFFASNVLEKKDPQLIITSIKIFTIILPYCDISSSTYYKKILHVFGKHCNSIKFIFKQSQKNQSKYPDLTVSSTLLYSCELSLKILAFCHTVINNPKYIMDLLTVSKEISQREKFIKKLGKEVKDFLVESAIPNWHLLEESATSMYTERRTNLESLIISINALYDLCIFNNQDKSDVQLRITDSGCVAFMIKFIESPHHVMPDIVSLEIIRLLSKMLAHWAAIEKKLIGQVVGEQQDLESYLCTELTKVLEIHPQNRQSIAYHFLIYYESQYRLEKWQCPFEVIVETILKTPNNVLIKNLPLVKVLWFFMSHLIKSECQRPHNMAEAASKLFTVIDTKGVENCFTGCPETVVFTLLSPIAHRIKAKVVEMWIRQNVDVQLLKLHQTHRLLASCLWKVLLTVGDDHLKCVEAAIKSGLSLNVDFCQQFDGLLIENLPGILGHFDLANEAKFSTIMHLWSLRFSYLKLPKDFAFICAPNIIRIIVQQSKKLLLIRQSMLTFLRDMLHDCRERSDIRPIKIFIRHFEMIKTLYAYLPLMLNDIHRFMDIFGALLEFQRDNNFELQSTESITIENDEFMSELMTYCHTMCEKSIVFWTILFSEVVEKPIFQILKCISEDAISPIAFYVLKEVISFEKQCRNWKWPMIYQCLITIFQYCQRKKFTKLLNKLCDSPEIGHFVEYRMYLEENIDEFFNFLVKWLEICLTIPTKSCQRLMEPNDTVKDHWQVVSLLERIVIKLQRHLQHTLPRYSHLSPKVLQDIQIIYANFNFNFNQSSTGACGEPTFKADGTLSLNNS